MNWPSFLRSRQSSAILVFVLVKLLYIALFYTLLSGVANLGDTADYAESVHLESEGSGAFAVLLSLLSLLVGGQVWLFDLLFLAYSAWILRSVLSDDRVPTIAKQSIWLAFMMPYSLLFLTVYSKESFIFVALTSAFWLNRLGRLAQAAVFLMGTAFMVFAKPTFVLAYVYFCLHSTRRVPAMVPALVLLMFGLVGLVLSDFALIKLYRTVAHHFESGSLTYGYPNLDGGGIPFWALSRVTMTDFMTFGLQPKALFLQLSFHLLIAFAFVAVIPSRLSTPVFRVLPTVMVVLFSFMPYSLFNLGSFARYATPLLLVMIIFVVRNHYCASRRPWIEQPALVVPH